MKNKKRLYSNRILPWMIILLFALPLTGMAQLKYLGIIPPMPDHPRILLLKGEENNIKKNITTDPDWANVHQNILGECDRILSTGPLERSMTGKRLLSVSREALRRIFFLSYAHRMTGDEKYFRRAEKEMLAVSGFTNWNPSHFLDVGEMALGLSIGYDWLYDSLSPASRTVIKDAILKKGLDPSFSSRHAWFLKSSNNWNQVCNAGMSFGALAIYEEIPELSKTIIDRALQTIQLSMGEYAPDGAYPEGYGYWDYGTTFNVLFLSAIDKVFKKDYQLTELPGFLSTAAYFENMIAPSGKCYNYADCGLGGNLSPAMFWFATRTQDYSLLWNEKNYLTDKKNKDYLKNRVLPAVMVWGSTIKTENIPAPTQNMWVGQGKNPVALMRSSWTDPNAIYVGFKGGTASSSHAHMDAGSFIMEANGVRWAMDFGMQDYNSLESKGVDLWNGAQNSQRWQVFRYNNFAHNTLTVDQQLHNVKGYAKIDSWSSEPSWMNATTDLSDIFKGQLKAAKRGVAIAEKKYVVVRDEIETLDKPTSVCWTLLTPAEVKITGKNSVELRSKGKKLTLKAVEPQQVNIRIKSTQSPNDYDAPNPGTTLIVIETEIPAHTNAAISVLLIPEKTGANQSVQKLSNWPGDKK